ncbi:MAG: hypothetical protein ACPHE0_08355, partial [Pseudomonadales bacterium]
MASDSEASNIFRSPLMLGLITLLLMLFAGLAGNIYLMGSSNGENPHLFKASVLKDDSPFTKASARAPVKKWTDVAGEHYTYSADERPESLTLEAPNIFLTKIPRQNAAGKMRRHKTRCKKNTGQARRTQRRRNATKRTHRQ